MSELGRGVKLLRMLEIALTALRLGVLAGGLGLGLAASAQAQQGLPDLNALAAAAEAGNPAAQLELAELYLTGRRVAQDFTAAAALLAPAAAAGSAEARFRLAELYATGRGVPQDGARALELFAAAAAAGDPEHIHAYAAALEAGIAGAPDEAAAAAQYARAAQLGWIESAVSLGVLYQEGRGVVQDFAQAVALWTPAAEAGNARAQNNLGMMYARGTGVAQDYELAAQFFAAAADQGLSVAIRNLGVMYANGFGVETDEEEAQRLYRLAAQVDAKASAGFYFDARLAEPAAQDTETLLIAAEAGDPVAIYLLGYLVASRAESGADLRQAAALFERAAEQGMAAAMANLGLMAFRGRGRLQDYVEGYRWLTLAAKSGLPGIEALRDELAAEMTAEQIAAANRAARGAE